MLKPKSFFSLDMLNLMRQWLNRFQMSRLIFDCSTKVAHIGVPSTYLNIVFSGTARPIELKLHMKTPENRLAKIDTN